MTPKAGVINQLRLKSLVMENTTPTARVTPLCALCEKQGHVTNLCPTLSKLRNLIDTIVNMMHASQAVVGGIPSTLYFPNNTAKSKSL